MKQMQQNLINQMKLVDSETQFLAREPGEFGFTLEQEIEFIKNTNKNEKYTVSSCRSRWCYCRKLFSRNGYELQEVLHRAAMECHKEDYWVWDR